MAVRELVRQAGSNLEGVDILPAEVFGKGLLALIPTCVMHFPLRIRNLILVVPNYMNLNLAESEA